MILIIKLIVNMKIDCPLENYLKKGLHDPLYSILRAKAVIPTSQYNSVGDKNRFW